MSSTECAIQSLLKKCRKDKEELQALMQMQEGCAEAAASYFAEVDAHLHSIEKYEAAAARMGGSMAMTSDKSALALRFLTSNVHSMLEFMRGIVPFVPEGRAPQVQEALKVHQEALAIIQELRQKDISVLKMQESREKGSSNRGCVH